MILRTPLQALRAQTRMANVALNPVGALLELLTQTKLSLDNLCTHQSANQLQDGTWVYVIVVDFDNHSYTGTGEASSKQGAKHLAYRSIHDQLAPRLHALRDQVRSNMAPVEDPSILKDLAYRLIHEHINVALGISKYLNKAVCVHIIGEITAPYKVVSIDDRMFSYQELDGEIFALSKTAQHFVGPRASSISDLYYLQPRTYRSIDGMKTFVHHDTVANMGVNDTPIEPVAQVGVMDNPGTSTIPHLPNPQPTAITPAVAAQDPSLVSALEPLLPHETLNPLGPPNMLGVGGITFDIKDLIYSQYLDCDVQYQYTDDTAQGQIIFQIPYDPTSQYVNPYIRQWLQLHPRYTGALNFRFTVIGNATFSGLIGFAWYPRPINGTTVKISEMMKYSYTSMGVNEPSNRIFTLFDARQTKFWRDTSDPTDGDVRPCLIAFVYMTAVSPLKEGITIRIRVASKLSDGSDGPPFVAAEPTLPQVTAQVGQPAPVGVNVNYANLLTGMPFIPVIGRPLAIDAPLYLYTDGVVFKPLLTAFGGDDFVNSPAAIWAGTPSYSTSSPISVGLCTSIQTSSNPHPGCLKFQGGYVLDMTHCPTLAYITSTDPSNPGLSPIQNSFWSLYAIKATDDQDLDRLNNIISNYAKLYLVINYKVNILDPSNRPSIRLYPTSTGSGVVYQYDVAEMVMYVTDKGPIFLSHFHFNEICYDTVPITAGAEYTYQMKSFTNDPVISLTQINAAYPQAGYNPETMPLGWRNITVSSDAPYVTPAAYTYFQSYNHPSVQTIFNQMAILATRTQCIQVTLSDTDSGTDLAYLRFFPDRNCVAINVGPNQDGYINASLTRPLTRVYISHVDVVERSNTFPITNVLNFSENTLPSALVAQRRSKEFRKMLYHTPDMTTLKYDPSHDGPIKSNAMLGGAIAGAAGGLWQGLGNAASAVGQHFDKIAEREFMEKLLGINAGNMFQYQENQNSFLSAISRQGSQQQLHNQLQLMTYNQELMGYRTPGAVAGMNRAGLGGSGLPNSQRRDSTTSTETDGSSESPPPYDLGLKTGAYTEASTQTDSKRGVDVGTQAGRIPLPNASRGALPSPAGPPKRKRARKPYEMSGAVGLNSVMMNPDRKRRVGVSNPSGVGGVGNSAGMINFNHPRMQDAIKGISVY